MSLQPKIINILPLGDSITEGAGTHSGYRFFLHNLLIENGISFRFVGPKKAYDPRMADRYQYHAGYGGNTIGPDNSRNGNLFSRLPDILKCDVDIILLMMGRNNYFQNIDLDRIDEVYYNFVKEILKYKPNVHIFIGTMNYSKGGNIPSDTALKGLNPLLPAVCKRLKNEGYNIHFTDIATRSNLCEVEFYPHDNTHPNDIGQEKIARVWFEDILPLAKELNQEKEEHDDDIIPDDFRLKESELTIKENEEYQLNTVFTPHKPYEFSTVWESDNKCVKVDTFGRITANSCGSATVTARHLESGMISKCNVTVNRASVQEEQVIAENLFSSADNWTGDTNMVNESRILMWFIHRDFKINTKEKFKTSKRFKISFEYQITDNKGVLFGNYFCVKFGALEVRLYDGVTSAEILVDGKTLGKWESYPEIESRFYSLCYDDGQITLYKGGERLITCSQKIEFVPSDIELYSSEGERFCLTRNLSISNLI